MPEIGIIKGLIDGGSKSLKSAIAKVTPEQFGAKGDGTTDDSEAVQAACDAGYEVRFADNKTYYLADTVTIDHDVHLVGGKNTVIKTATPTGGVVNDAINVMGTLKKTTTLTSDYIHNGIETENSGDRWKLTDMTGINIGDMMIITATDQLYSYSRDYYYLGGCLLVADVTDDYIWTSDVLPFDIENTENVTVEVYDAPTAIVENLKFVSDNDSAGNYRYPFRLYYCKNSVVRNVTVSQADNGIQIRNCVNTLVDGASISKMPLSGTGRALDHYAICIHSSSNTIVERLLGNTANNSIDLTGTIPNVNTFVKNCNLFALSRFTGLGMHENAYNTVVEDCVIGGFVAFGTVTVNRCRFVKSNRYPNDVCGISFRGSHVPEFGRLTVTNCVFDSTYTPIVIPTPSGQDNPTPYNHVIDEVTIENCTGGAFQYTAAVSEVALSNRIKRLTLRNWHNCKEVYHIASALVDEMVVENCQFTHKTWINDHENHLAIAGISCLRLKNDCGQVDKIYAEITANGGQYYLPANAIVNFASNTQTDIYQVCGRNVASNDTGDWEMGTVGGWEGDSLSRTKDNRYSSALSTNASGELVWTQPNNSDKTSLYTKCLVYVPAGKYIRMSCKLKNTGNTSGATFRPCLAVVDCATGKITYRNNHGTVTADASGAVATYDRGMDDDSLVLFFLYNSTVVQGSETTISEFVVEVVTADFYDVSYEQYEGSSRVGDGSLLSVEGLNNILVNAAGTFTANLKANMMERQ